MHPAHPTAPDWRRFQVARGDGEKSNLATGIDTTNSTLDKARLVRTAPGDSGLNRWSGVYVFTTRDFSGTTTRMRVKTYGADYRTRQTFDGPAPGFDLSQIAYVDAATRTLMLITGQVWDIAAGQIVGQIHGDETPWYIESTGAFYVVEVGATPHPWGLVDAKTGAVVAGGENAHELVISRLELDPQWNARRVEVARAEVPIDRISTNSTRRWRSGLSCRARRGWSTSPAA